MKQDSLLLAQQDDMSTKYPNQIDNNATLPKANTNAQLISCLNNIRDAVIGIQKELGINPAGVFPTLLARIEHAEFELRYIFSYFGNNNDGSLNFINIKNFGLNNPTPEFKLDIQGDFRISTPDTEKDYKIILNNNNIKNDGIYSLGSFVEDKTQSAAIFELNNEGSGLKKGFDLRLSGQNTNSIAMLNTNRINTENASDEITINIGTVGSMNIVDAPVSEKNIGQVNLINGSKQNIGTLNRVSGGESNIASYSKIIGSGIGTYLDLTGDNKLRAANISAAVVANVDEQDLFVGLNNNIEKVKINSAGSVSCTEIDTAQLKINGIAVDFNFTGYHAYSLYDTDLSEGDLVKLKDGKIQKTTSEKEASVAGMFIKYEDAKCSLTGINAKCAIIASLGDSRYLSSSNGIKVCGSGGDIKEGDLLCSANIPGVLRKQPEATVKNYTIAKAMQNISFSSKEEIKTTYVYFK